MTARQRVQLWKAGDFFVALLIFLTLSVSTLMAEEASTKAAASEDRGLSAWMAKRFQRKGGESAPATGETETLKASAEVEAVEPPLTTELYPAKPSSTNYKGTRFERDVEEVLEGLYEGLETRAEQIDDPELLTGNLSGVLDESGKFDAVWNDLIRQGFWPAQKQVTRSVDETYALSLLHSNQVRSATKTPLIRETALVEAGETYALEAFAEGDIQHSDEPTGSLLSTGSTGRFVQDDKNGEVGVRKRFLTGTELRLSNQLGTLDNNSDFLDPNPQTSSEVGISLIQPIFRGGGYQYHQSIFRLAELDSEVASVGFLRGLEGHLLTVNQAYWGVYLARAAYLQRKEMVKETRDILAKMDDRARLDADATASERLRAQATLKKREADLARTKMQIKIAEERLRALVNDPDMPMGSTGEMIPVTRPQLSLPHEDVRLAVVMALNNRGEVVQSALAVRAAVIRWNQAVKDLKPQLDIVAEVGVSALDRDRDLGGAYSDLSGQDPAWRAGIRFSQPLERRFVRAKVQRRELEYQQAVDNFMIRADQIMLESLVSYREMLASYRDMTGKYEAVTASREDLHQLRDRLNIDADGNRNTVSYQLQLILDAMDRNKQAEEEFLVSVVTYNTALAALEQSKGTFLQYNNVEILREETDDVLESDSLKVQMR
tara:strand:- start:17488 stop:19473 length:1986 start_codon:yes stop_codon:yes gene_type:complete